jgi:hypothetical protein
MEFRQLGGWGAGRLYDIQGNYSPFCLLAPWPEKNIERPS